MAHELVAEPQAVLVEHAVVVHDDCVVQVPPSARSSARAGLEILQEAERAARLISFRKVCVEKSMVIA